MSRRGARTLERGSVVYAQLDPVVGHEQAGHRPVLIVSDTRVNECSGRLIAMPLTSQPPKLGYPFSIELGVIGTSRVRSYVLPGQVRTLSVERLGRLLGRVESVDPMLDALLQICGRPVEASAKPENDE